MIQLQDLPTELLAHIFDFIGRFDPDALITAINTTTGNQTGDNKIDDEIDDGDDEEGKILASIRRDLCAICLVSRKFRDLGQPLLFQNFIDEDQTGDLGKTICFTRTIYRRPDLGKHVHRITIASNNMLPVDPRSLAPEDLKLFKGAIQELQLGDQQEIWNLAMEKSDLSVFAALLVNKTPNLIALRLPGGQFFMKPFSHLFARNPSFLSKLENIWIECEDELSGYNIASYQEFLNLPKVTEAEFEYGDLVDDAFPSTWAPGTLATERASFEHCHIDAGGLKRFMQACRKIVRFSYGNFTLDPHYRRTPSRRGASEFNAAQFHEAILHHKDTLEEFRLEFAREPWDIEDIDEYLNSQAKIGSFRDFSTLKVIFISHALLPSHPQLPPSLVELHVADCNSSIRELVSNIAHDCKAGLLPKLVEFKVLSIDITQPIKLPGQRIPPGKTPEQCFLSLRSQFDDTNVDFHILPYRLPDWDAYDDMDPDIDYEPEEHGDFPWLNGPGFGPMPQQLFDMIMQRALQDPDFAHLRPHSESGGSWVTDDDDDE